MSAPKRRKPRRRISKYLRLLEAVDRACYKLWRFTPINSALLHRISAFQMRHIHPAIRREREPMSDAKSLSELRDEWTEKLHAKFVAGVKAGRPGKCKCPLCLHDFDYVSEHAANLEMKNFCLGNKLAETIERERRLTEVVSDVVALAKAGQWSGSRRTLDNALSLVTPGAAPTGGGK